jgi:hypothetical protein
LLEQAANEMIYMPGYSKILPDEDALLPAIIPLCIEGNCVGRKKKGGGCDDRPEGN